MPVDTSNYKPDNDVRDREDEIRDLIRKNYELTEEIYKMTKKIKGYITFQKFMAFIYILIIVVPIVLSIIYLPPLLKGVMGQYGELLGGSSSSSIQDLLKAGSGQLDINKLSPDLQKLLNK